MDFTTLVLYYPLLAFYVRTRYAIAQLKQLLANQITTQFQPIQL